MGKIHNFAILVGLLSATHLNINTNEATTTQGRGGGADICLLK